MFAIMGTPNEDDWPGCSELPLMQKFSFTPKRPFQLHNVISPNSVTTHTWDLLCK